MIKDNRSGKRCKTNLENQRKNTRKFSFNLIFNNQSWFLSLHPLKKCFIKITFSGYDLLDKSFVPITFLRGAILI